MGVGMSVGHAANVGAEPLIHKPANPPETSEKPPVNQPHGLVRRLRRNREGQGMSQGSAEAAAPPARGFVASGLAALRFLATDRLGLLVVIWALIAFAARPVLLAAHAGAAGWPMDSIRTAMTPVSLAHIASVIQWASFAGLLALVVISHIRYAAAKGEGAFSSLATQFWLAAGYTTLMAIGYLAFVYSPVSVFTLITHDSLIFFDSTYRISNGLVPSNDFPTALGAAQLYLPAWAAWLTGGYAGSVELASVWVAMALGLACAWIGASRFSIGVTGTLIGIVFLVTVPAALLEQWGGESQTLVNGETEVLGDNLSYAMFYNRWGWAALIPLFMVFAPRREQDEAPGLGEIAALAAILTFMFWLKATYFVVGIAAAGVYAYLNAKPLRTLAWGVALTAGMVVLIGIFTGNLIAYVNDIIFAGQVSGTRTESLLGLIRKNLQDMLFAVAPLGILAAMGRFTWRDLLAGGFIMAACIFIINQNGQLKNMSALIVLAAYGAVRVLQEEGGQRMGRIAAVGAFAMLAGAVVLERSLVLIDQAYATLREQIRQPAPWARETALRNVYVPERESLFNRAVNMSETPDDRLHNIWLSGQLGRRQELRQGEYMETLMAGVDDLKTVVKPGESITTLDMTNPFPFLMNARAPKGGWLTVHKNRTVSEEKHPDAEAMFADTDHVMISKMSMVQATADLMRDLYSPWLDEHYASRVETAYWTRWSHRKPGLRPATQMALIPPKAPISGPSSTLP